MKLAKKILACVIALALVGCFASVAFAEGKVDVKVTAGKAVVGEKVDVTVTFTNTVGIATAEAYLNYNGDVLSIADPEDDDVKPGDFATGFNKEKENCLSMGYTIANSCKAESLVVVFTFEVKAAGDLGLAIDGFAVEDPDGEDLTGEADLSAVANAKATEEAEEEETTTVAGEETTTKAIPPMGDTAVASLSVAAGLVALAGATFVVSKKRK